MAQPVPCAVLVGFLGSGKTTLLNDLLAQLSEQQQRVGVVLNEFAEEFGMNNELLASAKHNSTAQDQEAKSPVHTHTDASGHHHSAVVEEVFEFGGGCICCASGEEFEQTLTRMSHITPPLDYIIVETTGRADPAPIAQLLSTSQALKGKLYLSTITAVVSAEHFGAQLQAAESPSGPEPALGEYKNEAEVQVVFADTVLLNKTDRVAPSDVQRVRQQIQTLNPTAKIVATSYSKVPWTAVLQRSAGLSPSVVEMLRAAPPTTTDWTSMTLQSVSQDMSARESSAFRTLYQEHDPTVKALCLAYPGSIEPDKLLQWLASVLPAPGQNSGDGPVVYRVKAVVAAPGNPRRVVVQGVYNVLESHEHRPWKPSEERATLVVMIGRRLAPVRSSWDRSLAAMTSATGGG